MVLSDFDYEQIVKSCIKYDATLGVYYLDCKNLGSASSNGTELDKNQTVKEGFDSATNKLRIVEP